VQADDLLSRIIVQCCRQAGLSAVYSELLDFEGCEIYTIALPALQNVRYGEALMLFEEGALIGVCDEAGNVTLNPPAEYVLLGDRAGARYRRRQELHPAKRKRLERKY
jgi:hypothetical protein